MYNVYRFPERSEYVYKHVLTKRRLFTGTKADAQEYTERLSNSKSRTRRLFFEYAMCNRLPLFVTGTFDGNKVGDRGDYAVFKKLCQWFSDYRKRKDPDFLYMIIAENHEDGAWHYHGLITPPVGLCCPMQIPKKVGGRVRMIPNTPGYMAWPALSEKFGFFSCSYVKDYEKAVGYCCKYISKALEDVTFKNKHILFKSQGLNKPELVHSDFTNNRAFRADFENEFCAVSWMNEDGTAPVYRHWTYITDEEFANIRTMNIFEATMVYGVQMGLSDYEQ